VLRRDGVGPILLWSRDVFISKSFLGALLFVVFPCGSDELH
jgi:hypothetical protein